jgi:hypothetical protein
MRGILAAGVVIAVTALAGCTDDPEPRFEEPTESPSASESTSPAADPQPWEEKSKAGAVAFARHWIDVFNEAQATGEVEDLAALSSPNCKTCRGYVDQLRDLYGAGGRLESEGWRVLVVAPSGGEITDKAEVTVRVNRSVQRVMDGDGKSEQFPGGKATYSADLVWSDGWRMDRLVRFV